MQSRLSHSRSGLNRLPHAIQRSLRVRKLTDLLNLYSQSKPEERTGWPAGLSLSRALSCDPRTASRNHCKRTSLHRSDRSDKVTQTHTTAFGHPLLRRCGHQADIPHVRIGSWHTDWLPILNYCWKTAIMRESEQQKLMLASWCRSPVLQNLTAACFTSMYSRALHGRAAVSQKS